MAYLNLTTDKCGSTHLDAHHKKSLLQFLHEFDLINATTGSIVQLEGADLSGAIITQEQMDTVKFKPTETT